MSENWSSPQAERLTQLNMSSTCLVVTADLASLTPTGTRLLDDRETVRLHDIVRPKDQDRFVAGASLLRLVVSRVVGVAAADVEVDRTCRDCGEWHGRPEVSWSGLHISVSHSGDAVQVACTGSARVGVDIQSRRSVVTPAMRALLADAGSPSRDTEEFLITWTRVEAVVKATGEGLRVPLDQVRVSGPHDAPVLLSYREESLPCQLFDQRPRTDHVGAVAVLGREPIKLLELSVQQFLDAQRPAVGASSGLASPQP